MKIQSVLLKIYRLIKGRQMPEKLQLLKQQQFLLRGGMEASAEVMDAAIFENKAGNTFIVKLWIKLKKGDGSFVYTHTHSLVPLNMVPGKGQMLRVKYLPGNLSAILILAIIPN